MVLVKDDSAIILDVAVMFENGLEALSKARNIKIEKYSTTAETLRNRFNHVSIAPIIVGSLGSWDPLNDRLLLRLCSKKYLKLMRKLIVADTIRYSRDIFYEHTTGKKQSQPSRYRRRNITASPQPINLYVTVAHDSSNRRVELIHDTSPNSSSSSNSASQDEIPQHLQVEIKVSSVLQVEPVTVSVDTLTSNRHVLVTDCSLLEDLDQIHAAASSHDSSSRFP